MATYAELASIKQDAGFGVLAGKISVAISKKAYAIALDAGATALQIQWAKEALASPDTKRQQIENFVIAANADATVAQILGASDPAIQNNVNGAVDNLLGK